MTTKKTSKKADLETGTNEQKVIDEPEAPHYVFKSKYSDDSVTLTKPVKTVLPGGQVETVAEESAEFHRFTFGTDDAEKAEKLRGVIATRLKSGTPIHILETSNTKE